MTQEQLDVADRHVESYTRDVLGYPKPNMRFIQVRTSWYALHQCTHFIGTCNPVLQFFAHLETWFFTLRHMLGYQRGTSGMRFMKVKQ